MREANKRPIPDAAIAGLLPTGCYGSRVQVTRKTLREGFPHGGWWRRVVPMPELGCVFVKNAKAGVTTTMLWLHRVYTGDYDWIPVSGGLAGNRLPRPDDVGRDDVAAMLGGAAYRFTFVRHPADRIESAYRDKMLRVPRDKWRADIRRTLGLPDEVGLVPTFDQFIAAIEAQESASMDQHWRPQHLNLMHPLVTYDHIGRVETYAADCGRIRDALDLPALPVEHKNATGRGGSLFDGRPSLRRRVEALYVADFELYGY